MPRSAFFVEVKIVAARGFQDDSHSTVEACEDRDLNPLG